MTFATASGQHHDDFFPSNTRLWRVVLGIDMNISAHSANRTAEMSQA